VEITEVRVKLMEEPGERLQAFCSITFDDAFVVRDLKVIEGTTGPFVAMPSRKLTAHCPQCGCKNHLRAAYCNQCGARLREQPAVKDEEGRAKLYADIAHPINCHCREMIQQRVIAAFAEEKARSQLPGYVPSYDDFDGEDSPMPPRPPHVRSIEPAQVQGAERPRGPHRAPSQPAPRKGPAKGGFGAGIFD
jgi:stage V sporulation protein G